MTNAAAATIADQNDRFRRCLFGLRDVPGRTVMTSGIAAVGADRLLRILKSVEAFDTFTPDNDPHGEHDFGRIVDDGDAIYWKFDYYEDDTMKFGADDARRSYRVLTILFANEY
jgi:hypothetical protein